MAVLDQAAGGGTGLVVAERLLAKTLDLLHLLLIDAGISGQTKSLGVEIGDFEFVDADIGQ